MPKRIPRYKPPKVGAAQPNDDRRPNAHARGYCSKAHKAWRRDVLLRGEMKCVSCGEVFSNSRDLHADHIIPIAQGGSRFSLDNGQILCVRCHARKTLKENQNEFFSQ